MLRIAPRPVHVHPLLPALLLSLACSRADRPASAPAEAPPTPVGPAAAARPAAQEEPTPDPQARQIAEELYTFAYPLVLMDVTREVMTSHVPMNTFHHMREFPDPTFKEVVSPNADTLYSTAWLDLSREPMVLSLPDTGKRYYLMPMLDGWTEVFASPGTRTTGNRGGNFAIVGPDYKGELPPGVTEIRAPTAMVWILGRTGTYGKGDYAAVAKLQDQYRLTPLSAWGEHAAIEPPAPTPAVDTTTPPVVQVDNMSAEQFFTRFAALLPNNPLTPDDAPMRAKLRELELTPGEPFRLAALGQAQELGVKEGVRDALAKIIAAATAPAGDLVGGWKLYRDLGKYGTDYTRRAMVAHFGLGANLPADAIYAAARTDADGQPLTGEHRYVLHFDKGQTPPVGGFWSLTMYDDQQFFVDNPLGRYAIGDRDRLRFNKDGSLDLYVQRESPGKGKESNWLPAPAGPFNLMLRLYWPEEPVLKGEWTPPPATRVP